jgi:hypothetical protein
MAEDSRQELAKLLVCMYVEGGVASFNSLVSHVVLSIQRVCVLEGGGHTTLALLNLPTQVLLLKPPQICNFLYLKGSNICSGTEAQCVPIPFPSRSLFWLDLCRVVLLMMAGWAYQLMRREDGRPGRKRCTVGASLIIFELLCRGNFGICTVYR